MSRLASSVRGAAVMLLFTLNLFFWGCPFYAGMLLKLVVYPSARMRNRVVLWLAEIATAWTIGNKFIISTFIRTQWRIRLPEGLGPSGRYLMIANHQSWVDIIVLLEAFRRRVPFLRFFVKQELIWLPVAGQACWGLEFPFMRRYTPEYLERHPEKRGEDLATTKKACERYAHIPVTVLNFAEGTRFSPAKHAQSRSPYRHLLPPRTGGIAYVIASLGRQIDGVLDTTIAYPGTTVSMWDFACGRIPLIVVEAELLRLPDRFISDGITEPGPLRDEFKEWLRDRWAQKDERLAQLEGEPASPTGNST